MIRGAYADDVETPSSILRKSSHNRRDPTKLLPFVAVAAALLLIARAVWSNPPFSPDSWAYYELSQTLGSGDYTLGHLRAYAPEDAAGPSRAFPPLWPALWGAASYASGFGARAGLALNVLVCLTFLVVSEHVGRTLTKLHWVGLASGLFATALPGYVQELTAARSMPLLMLLACVSLLIMAEDLYRGVWSSAVSGVLASAIAMTRFDAVPLAVAVVLGATRLASSTGSRLICLVAFGGVLAPWMVISIHFHGTPFASDNTAVAWSADPAYFVTDWYPPGKNPPTVREQPMLWLQKVAVNAGKLIGIAVVGAGPLSLVVLSVVVIAVVWRLLVHNDEMAHRLGLFIRSRAAIALSSLTCGALLMLPAFVLTGYLEPRYFTLCTWIVTLWLAVITCMAWPTAADHVILGRASLGLSAILAALMVHNGFSAAWPKSSVPFPLVPEAAAVQRCVLFASDGHRRRRILCLDATLAAKLSAVHGIATAFIPKNFGRQPLGPDDFRLFCEKYDIGFAYGDRTLLSGLLPEESLSDRPVCDNTPWLYGCGNPQPSF